MWHTSEHNLFPTRNLFFLQLTGKAQGSPSAEEVANWLASPVLTAKALPVTWLGAVSRRGGTLILASQ